MSNITQNELRIGNIVSPKGANPKSLGRELHITSIGKYGEILVTDPSKDFGPYIDRTACLSHLEYAPIPITHVWLLRLGWQYLQGRTDGELTKDAFKARLEIDYDEKGIKIKSRYLGLDEYRYLDHIKFIHQLQNLYFFLEGVELEVKP